MLLYNKRFMQHSSGGSILQPSVHECYSVVWVWLWQRQKAQFQFEPNGEVIYTSPKSLSQVGRSYIPLFEPNGYDIPLFEPSGKITNIFQLNFCEYDRDAREMQSAKVTSLRAFMPMQCSRINNVFGKKI